MPPVLARDPVDVMFQIAGTGPMFGQVGHFHLFDGKAITDPRPLQRYASEARRLAGQPPATPRRPARTDVAATRLTTQLHFLSENILGGAGGRQPPAFSFNP